MRKTTKRATALTLSVLMAVGSLAGCGFKEETKETESESAKIETEGTEVAGDTAVDPDRPYAGTKLTWYSKLNANVSTTYPNLGDTPWAQYVMEKTGIEIEFIHPTVGSEEEEFSILIASGEYPDIIENMWTSYPGGPQAAINDGVIIDLDDVMANNAPNFGGSPGYRQESKDNKWFLLLLPIPAWSGITKYYTV